LTASRFRGRRGRAYVLDTSALLAYASGASVEPGALLALADEDPGQQVWIPALCLGQAQPERTGSPNAAMLDLLVSPDRDIQIAGYDGPTSRRVARIAATYRSTSHTRSLPPCCAGATWSPAIRRRRQRPAQPGSKSWTSAKLGLSLPTCRARGVGYQNRWPVAEHGDRHPACKTFWTSPICCD
jgi:hypothetical protein